MSFAPVVWSRLTMSAGSRSPTWEYVSSAYLAVNRNRGMAESSCPGTPRVIIRFTDYPSGVLVSCPGPIRESPAVRVHVTHLVSTPHQRTVNRSSKSAARRGETAGNSRHASEEAWNRRHDAAGGKVGLGGRGAAGAVYVLVSGPLKRIGADGVVLR